eukprot:gene30934-38233_t
MSQVEQNVANLQRLISELTSKVAALETHDRALDSVYVPGETKISELNDGDTAWMLTSTALVLFMTIPGLMLYYSGMVRSKNVLATVMQVFSIACLITVLWLAFGYSLAFGPALPVPFNTSSPVFGDASRFWLQGMHIDSYHQLAPTIPEAVFCMYQMTFAIITPALICGSFADRMKYGPMLIFITLWHLLVYCPVAHSVWHPEGFLFKAQVLDYAGGCVVHIASGVSGLVSVIVLGQRKGFGKEIFEPHNILLTAVGSSMLWVGWFGFNAGSALGANERAGFAMLTTQIATGTAAMTWMMTEWAVRGTPSVLGMVSGAIAGLVSITPAAGFVDPTGAFIIGLLGGPVCYFGAQLKHYAGFDDALDAFGVHAIGGIFGGLMTGFFATHYVDGQNADGVGIDGVFYADTHIGGTQFGKQIYGIVVVSGWAAFMSLIILMSLDLTIGLRVSDEQEDEGLDEALHKESIFDSQHGRRVPISPHAIAGSDKHKDAEMSKDVMKSLEMTPVSMNEV